MVRWHCNRAPRSGEFALRPEPARPPFIAHGRRAAHRLIGLIADGLTVLAVSPLPVCTRRAPVISRGQQAAAPWGRSMSGSSRRQMARTWWHMGEFAALLSAGDGVAAHRPEAWFRPYVTVPAYRVPQV